MVVLMLYDYLLTVADEIEFVWRRRMRFSTWILLANRAAIVFYMSNLAASSVNFTVSVHPFVDVTAALKIALSRRTSDPCRLTNEARLINLSRCGGVLIMEDLYILLSFITNAGERTALASR